MGIKATVIYDTPTHTPLVLRLHSYSLSARHEIINTVSSFSSHCDSLRGVARSVQQVCAQWGGPPYITYKVVASRLRCIVIWDRLPSEFDLAHDIDTCLARLEKTISPIANQLAQRDPIAITTAYDHAGYALSAESPHSFPDSTESKKAKSKLPSAPSTFQRRSSTADLKKKKSSTRLLGRLGNVLKSVTAADDIPDHQSESPAHSQTSLRPPSETAAMSVAQYGSENGSGFEASELQLPDEMFAWADFGPTSTSEDISWLKQLLQSQTTFNLPPPPKLRPGSATSTKLVIPTSNDASQPSISTAQPVPPNLPSALKSVLPVPRGDQASAPQPQEQPSPTPSNSQEPAKPPTTTPPKLPTQSTPSSAPAMPHRHSQPPTPLTPSRPQSHPIVSSAVPFASQNLNHGVTPGQTNPAIAQPALGNLQNAVPASGTRPPIPPNMAARNMQMNMGPQMMQQGVQNQWPMPSQGGLNMPSLMAQQSVYNGGGSVRTSSVASSVPGSMESPVPPSPMMKSDVSAIISPGSVPPVPGAAGSSSAVGNSRKSDIPPALLALQQESDFDVSGLGSLKDGSVVVAHGSGSGSGGPGMGGTLGERRAQRESDDDAIRTRMNEFAISMQAGNFALALQQVFATLKLLRQVQPRRERETITCANYVLAQKILMRNVALENELTRVMAGSVEAVRRRIECALLTMFLAELKHLLPRHRVAAMQVAVEKNMAVGNYGMCARWLRQLLERAPDRAKGELQAKLDVCARAGEQNAQMPVTNRLCYVTLQVLGVPYGKCNVCPAVYHPQMAGVVQGQVCPTCLVGGVEARMS